MARATPTTADLKAAFKRSGIWRSGWDFNRAIAVPSIRTSITCAARAHQAKHTHQGKPAPIQPALI